MGRMVVDKAYEPYIKRFQIILSPSVGQNTKATVCSYGDELTFTFSSLLKDTSVQKVFFRSLVEVVLKWRLKRMGCIMIDKNCFLMGGAFSHE